jgi:hypothetical protein
MRARTSHLVFVTLLVAALLAPLRAAEDPAGLWIGTTEVPNQGTDQVRLAITRIDGAYGGLMTDSLGVVAGEPLREVTFADGVLTFGFALTDGTPMRMKLKVTGDKMAGEWQHPEGDAGAIVFERRKAA